MPDPIMRNLYRAIAEWEHQRIVAAFTKPPTPTCRECGSDLPADWRDPSGLCAVCMFENITENLAS